MWSSSPFHPKVKWKKYKQGQCNKYSGSLEHGYPVVFLIGGTSKTTHKTNQFRAIKWVLFLWWKKSLCFPRNLAVRVDIFCRCVFSRKATSTDFAKKVRQLSFLIGASMLAFKIVGRSWGEGMRILWFNTKGVLFMYMIDSNNRFLGSLFLHLTSPLARDVRAQEAFWQPVVLQKNGKEPCQSSGWLMKPSKVSPHSTQLRWLDHEC